MTAQTAQLIRPGALFIAETALGTQVLEVLESSAQDGTVQVLSTISGIGYPIALPLPVDVLLKAYSHAGDVRRVRPGALFTRQEDEKLPVLVIEVVRVDHEDDAAVCVESLSNDATLTDAVFDVDLLESGAFAYMGDTVPDSEHLARPRVGDLFAYRLQPMADWPTEEQFVAEVAQIEKDGDVVVIVYDSSDRRGWFELYSPSEILREFAYLGRTGTGRDH